MRIYKKVISFDVETIKNIKAKARCPTQSYASDGGNNMEHNRKESLWIHCPICGGKTRTKVYEDTVLVKFPLYCPKCKKEIRVDVVQLKMVLSK